MNLKLKAALEQAIDDVLNKAGECSNPPWDGYIHGGLVLQMTNAAEQVFDSSMEGQKFAEDDAMLTHRNNEK